MSNFFNNGQRMPNIFERAKAMDLHNNAMGYHLGNQAIINDWSEEELLNQVINAANNGNEKATIAVKHFNYQVAAYVAKCAVAMGGMDAIIFTGGIGENQINIRKAICEHLAWMGVEIDLDKNNVRSEETKISTANSKVEVYIVPTDEEMVIAEETLKTIKK